MTLEESKEILKDWVRLDLEALDGDTESDYAKFVITKIEAIEVILKEVKEGYEMIEIIFDVRTLTSHTKVTCDSCGETFVAHRLEELLEKIKEKGWTNKMEDDEWVNYCMDCATDKGKYRTK